MIKADVAMGKPLFSKTTNNCFCYKNKGSFSSLLQAPSVFLELLWKAINYSVWPSAVEGDHFVVTLDIH